MNLHVDNLSYSVSDDDLNAIFSEHGEVKSARVIMDRIKGHSQGFGFVEMSDDKAAKAAIEALNGTKIDGRDIIVKEARRRKANRNKREDRRDRDGYNLDQQYFYTLQNVVSRIADSIFCIYGLFNFSFFFVIYLKYLKKVALYELVLYDSKFNTYMR